MQGTSAEPPPYTPAAAGLFSAKDHKDGKFHLLLAASGSVATIKLPNIINMLASHEYISIRIILTQSAAQFLQGQSSEQPDLNTLAGYPNVDGIYLDQDEWKVPWTRGAPILHIELRRWASLMVIAPLSANTLSKLSNGMCDNLLTSVVRAWEVLPPNDPAQRYIVVAPAMNTAMWRHPVTIEHLSRLSLPIRKSSQTWMRILKPVEKELACGDTGDGAMTDVSNIVVHIQDVMRTAKSMHRRSTS